MTRPTDEDLARLLAAAHGTTWRGQAGCVAYKATDRLDYPVLVRAGHGTDADVELAALAPVLAREVLKMRTKVKDLHGELTAAHAPPDTLGDDLFDDEDEADDEWRSCDICGADAYGGERCCECDPLEPPGVGS